MILKKTIIRVFAALLVVIFLLPLCALNTEKNILPLKKGGQIYDGDIFVKEEPPVISENKENVIVGVIRPDVGSPGETVEDTSGEVYTEIPEETTVDTTEEITEETAVDTTEEATEEITEETTEETTDAPVEETTEVIPEAPADTFVPYDVPLTIEQQKIVEKIAERFSVDEELIFGVMWVETKYNVNAVGKNAQYLGIMQISKSNLKNLEKRCGVTDLMDFEQNVISGCYFLSTYLTRYNGDKHITLIYYHGGWKYGDRMMSEGKYEDSYSRKVISEMNRIVEARKQLAAEMGVTLCGALYE